MAGTSSSNMRKVALLGASGNIGSQSLDLFAQDRTSFELVAISVGHHVEKIEGILASFPSVQSVCVQEEADAKSLQISHGNLHVYWGDDGLVSLLNDCGCDMVENALVGFSGLVPSLTSLRLGKILCLANKESLVVGGTIIERLLHEGKGQLYPIDSEHVAIAKCLSKVKREDVERLVITASGGAFRKLSRSELTGVTPEMALQHPTWKMGAKITIDSATMMNKGFEVIEAHYLFDWPVDKIEVLLHDESEVHSLLLMKDGTYYADVGKPDMHGPIAYAIYEGKAPFEVRHEKTIQDFGDYHFHAFDPKRYPAVPMALKALREGGIETTVLNAANEEAVHLFLEGKIPFLDIEQACSLALANFPNIMRPTLRDILTTDSLTRLYVRRKFGGQ
jgi:1-deoxy-D-xylulose-5-phosphate reductoisomerase